MDRFYNCTSVQRNILTIMYSYLGFNEVTSFEEFISFMFKNAKFSISFTNVVNHTLAHIVKSFESVYPQYHNNYIKYFWLNESNMIEHMKAGSSIEYDPKGLIRFFVKNNFDSLVATKI